MPGIRSVRYWLMLAGLGLAGCSSTADSLAPPDPVAKVMVNPASTSVAVCSTIRLTAVLEDAAGKSLNRAVSWSTGNPMVASVDQTGTVAGLSVGGPVTITAASGGKSATALVTVAKAQPAQLRVLPERTGLPLGHTLALAAVLLDACGHSVDSGFAAHWVSSNPAVASVDSVSGVVTAIAAGQASIYTSSQGLSGAADIVVFVPVTFASISAGWLHTCGLAGDRLLCWGWNRAGELGIGSTIGSPVPVPVSGSLRFKSVTSGAGAEDAYAHTCGLEVTGLADCWGDNSQGQLGAAATTQTCHVTDGLTVDRDDPCSTVPLPVTGGITFTDLSAGGNHTCGVAQDGQAYCWGANDHGQLGVGDLANRPAPTPVAGGLTFVAVRAGNAYTCGLTSSGAAFCWGSNADGQVGDGTSKGSTTPQAVGGGLSFVTISVGLSHTCALVSSGAAYCWGSGSLGELGTGGRSDSAVPVPVSGGIRFQSIAAGGSHSCAAAVDATAYCWGEPLGGTDPNAGDDLSPQAVAGGLSFAGVSVGDQHACGSATSGTVYCWGSNYAGQLGDGSGTDASTAPVKVAGQP